MNNPFNKLKALKINKISNSIGMTLMEIMIVLAIIGGLIAVLLPNIQSALNRSKIKQTRIAIGQVVQGINGYQIDCGKFPANLDALTKAPSDCPNWGPDPYMKSIPKDGFGHEFTYETNESGYVVKSPGYKGKEITSEDIQ
jgi:general secretion pathway protein G